MSLVRVLVVCSLCSRAAQALNPDLCDQDTRPHPRIVGGDVAKPGEFPFIVNIQTPEELICGGSIYNELTIVTAAHCVYSRKDKKSFLEMHGEALVVVAGDHNLASNVSEASEQIMEIERFFYHEKWVTEKVDIGLYILTKPLRFSSRVHPVMIATEEESQVVPRLIAAGWGFPVSVVSVHFPPPPVSCHLKKLNVPVYPNEYCSSVAVGELCVGEAGDSMCQGDSGGPLVYQDEAGCTKQVGLASAVEFPCGTKDVGYIVSLAYYLGWIEKRAVGRREHQCQTKYPEFKA